MVYPTIGDFGQRMPYNSFFSALQAIGHTLQTQSGLEYDIRSFEEEGFARIAFKKQGRADVKPLVLDLQPGVKTEFGPTIEMRSETGWPAIFGPEIWYGSQERGPELRRPMQNFQKYIEGSFRESNLAIDKDPQGWFYHLTGKGQPASEVSGGLIRYGPVHTESAAAEMSSRVTVGIGKGVLHQDAWQGIYRHAMQAGAGEDMGMLIPYAPFDDAERLRMRKAGVAQMEGEPGSAKWEVLGLGANASDILKRLNVVGGLREQAKLFQPTPSGRGVEEVQPDYIGGMGERAGYRWLNAIMPGETQRRAAIVRPGTYFSEGSPFPGAALTYRDPLKGIYSGGFPSERQRELPVQDFSRMGEATFNFGIFKEKRIRDTQGEVTRTEYVKQRALEGYILKGGEQAIIGTYTLPGGEETPIRYKAEGSRPEFFTGAPRLGLPVGFEKSSGAPTLGVGMLQSSRMNIQEYGVQQPGYKRPMSELIQERFAAGGGGQVQFGTEQASAQLYFPTATMTGISEKTVQKSAGTMATGVNQLLNDEALRVSAGRASMVMSGMTAESKSPLLQFMYEVGSMPTSTAGEAFGMLPGKTGRGLQQYVQNQAFQPPPQGAPADYEPPFDYEQVARRYAKFEGTRYQPDVTVYQMMEKLRGRVGAMPAEESMRMFGRAAFTQEQAPWAPIGFVTPEEREFYSKEMYRGMALGPGGKGGRGALTGEAATTRFNEMMRFQPVYKEGENAIMPEQPIEGRTPVGYMWSQKQAGYIGTSASPPTPEHLARSPTLGYEELAAINMMYPETAAAMNIRLKQGPEQAGPEGVNFMPRHARAWREVGNVYRYQRDKSLGDPIIPEEKTTLTPDLVRRLRTEMATNTEMSLPDLDKMIGGAGPLFNPETKELLERPSTISNIAAYRYGDPQMNDPLNFIVKKYPDALKALMGGETRERGALRTMEHQREMVFESKSGEAMKTFGGRWLSSTLGGRYAAATGLGLNEAVVTQERMDQMLRQTARARSIEPTEKRMTRWRGQVEQEGGIPGMVYRSPTISRTHGVLAMNMVTPSMIKARTGVDIEEASAVDAQGFARPGSVQATGVVAAFGPRVGSFIGDWDFDLATAMGLVDVDPTTNDLVFKGGGEVGRQLAMSPKEVMAQQDKALKLMLGEKGGVPGGELNVFANAFNEMVYGKETKASLSSVPAEDIHREGLSRVKSRYGMGVSYNIRRLMESSASALGVGREDIAQGHSAQALSYQQYLDYMVNFEEQGGFSNLETMVQTGIWTQNRGGDKAVRMMQMSGAKQQFSDVWTSTHSRTRDFSRDFGDILAKQVGGDISSGHMLPEAAAHLFQMKGMSAQNIAERLRGNKLGPGAELRKMVAEEGYDIMKTPVGLGVMTSTWGRTAGWLGRGKRMMTLASGEEVDVMSQISSEPFNFGGREIPIGMIGDQPEVMTTAASYQMLTRRGGPLGPVLSGMIAQQVAKGAPGTENLDPQVLEYITGQMGGGADLSAVQRTRIAQAGKISLSEEWLPDQPTVRGSQLRHFGSVAQMAGQEYGAEQLKSYADQAKMRMVATEVLGMSEGAKQRMFPVDASLSGPAARYERMVAGKMIQRGYTGMVSGLRHTQSAEMPLMYMGEEAGKYRFTGTPDIVGIAPEGHLEVVEAKWSAGDEKFSRGRALKKQISPGVRVQAAGYASGLEASAGIGRDFFLSAVSPWFGSREEASVIGGQWYEAIKTKGIQTRIATGILGGQGQPSMEDVQGPKGGYFDYRAYSQPAAPGESFPLRESVMGAVGFAQNIGQVSQSFAGLQGIAAAAQVPLGQVAAPTPQTVRRAGQAPAVTIRQTPTASTTPDTTAGEVYGALQQLQKNFPGLFAGLTQQPGGMPYIPALGVGRGGDQGGGVDQPFKIEFGGQGRHPAESARILQSGFNVGKQILGQMDPREGRFGRFYERARGFVSGEMGIYAGDLPNAQVLEEFGNLMSTQEGWGKVSRFMQEPGNRGAITQLAKEQRLVLRAAQMAESGKVDVSQEQAGVLGRLMSPGLPEGQMLALAKSLQEKGQAAGVMTGKPGEVLTESQMGAFGKRIDSIVANLGKFDEAIGSSEETITKEEKARLRGIQRDVLGAAAISRRGKLARYAEAERGHRAGEDIMSDEEYTAHLGGYMGELQREVAGRKAEGRLREEEGGPTLRAGSQALRRMIGGFGLFYMGTLARLGMGQFQQGYQEYEQFAGQMQGFGVQQAGAGAFDMRVSPEIAQQQAALRSGGGVMAAMRRAGAPLAGTPVSDIGGAALTGLGVYGLGMHIAGSMTAIPTLAGAGAAIGTIGAPLAGLAVGAGALMATQASYMMNREDTIQQVAAMRGGGPVGEPSYSGFLGWMGGGWKMAGINLADSFAQRPYYETAAYQAQELQTQVGALRQDAWAMNTRGMFEGQPLQDIQADRYSVARILGRDGSTRPEDPTGKPRVANVAWTGELSAGERVKLASTFAMTDIPELAHLPPEVKGKIMVGILGQQQIGKVLARAEQMVDDGATDEELSTFIKEEMGRRGATMEMVDKIGSAMVAGIPVMEIGKAARVLSGAGAISEGEISVTTGIGIAELGDRAPVVQAGMQLMGQVPGIQRQLQGRTEEEVLGLAESVYGQIAQGPFEDPFLRKEQMREQREWLGLETRVQPERYFRGRQWGPEMQYAETQRLQLQQRGATMATGLMAQGVSQPRAGGVINWAEVSGQRMAFAERAFQQDPVTLTQMSMAGAMPSMFASMDIRGGEITGLPWGQTGLQRGDMSAQAMATQIWGADYAQDEQLVAATEGLGTTLGDRDVPEYMQGMGGMRALQWESKMISRDARKAATGNQLAMLELQGRYQPLFWDIEDRQRGLQHRQAQWGFQMQERQFAMTGTQFGETRGLQAQQMQMQRQWTREDWSTQDQMRTMQWGWRQEDFQEQARFMTGRQRKLAERGMERETIMFGMEGDRLETQRKRQEETWALEDQRFEMTKRHFEEQRALQEENMKKQREFYDEGKKLRDEQVELQRAYWKEMHALQLAAAGAQASYAEQMDEVNDKMEALAHSQQDQAGLLRVAQSDSVKMTNTIIDGLNHVIQYAPEALKSILGEQEYIPKFSSTGDDDDGGGYTPMQAGGDVFPGHNYLVGDRGPEILRLGTIGSIVNQADLLDSGGYRSRWNDTMTFTPQGGGAAGGPQIINLYVGNELLRRFVLSTVKDDLEVT